MAAKQWKNENDTICYECGHLRNEPHIWRMRWELYSVHDKEGMPPRATGTCIWCPSCGRPMPKQLITERICGTQEEYEWQQY